VYVLDPLLIPERIHIVEKEFDDIVNYRDENVTIDMCGISYIDSMLMASLLRFRNRLFISGRELQLLNCSEKVIAGLRLAEIEDCFII